MKTIILISFLSLSFYSISQSLFSVRTAKDTGVDFENSLTETEAYINNDGLQDLFFVGNQVQNKLFLNKGNLKFDDISKSSGIEQATKFWDTGVSMIDINADGWLDIFVCRSGSADEKRTMTNLLYINQHDNAFKEQAKEYGFIDSKRSVQSAFLDYDRDGDLDVFIIQ